jgi:hypothetical protein
MPVHIMIRVPRLQRKGFNAPDEVRRFPNGEMKVVTLDEMSIALFSLESGWRWSKDVAPTAGTSFCRHRHVGYVISGALKTRMDDGTETTIAVGDVYEIPPGHDAWVVGDEPYEAVEFASAHDYGRSAEALDERVLSTVLFFGHRRFDVHARAARAAAQMDGAVKDLDLRLRIGLHTGEVELSGGQARGVAVRAAARICELAGPGEVLLSGTTRDLLEGAGLDFDSRGEHELKGLSGPRPIFALRV